MAESQMRYAGIFSYLFGYKDWLAPALLCTAGMLVPLVGPVFVHGWLVSLMHRRIRGGEHDLPSVDDLGGVFRAGLIPYVVNFIVGIPLVVLAIIGVYAGMALVFGLFYVLSEVFVNLWGDSGMFIGLVLASVSGTVVFVVGTALFMMATAVIQVLVLRAEVTGKFGSALSFNGLADQFRNMVRPLVVGQMLIGAMWFVALPLAYMTCGLGFYPLMFATVMWQSELRTQVYRRYLQQGGVPMLETSWLDGEPLLVSGKS